jgi:hypothetical protein
MAFLRRIPPFSLVSIFLVTGALSVASTTPGCSSDDTASSTPGATGGPVSGAADKHCIDTSGNAIKQVTDPAVCSGAGGSAGSAGSGGTAGAAGSGGMAGIGGTAGMGGAAGMGGGGEAGAGGMPMGDYGATLYNSSGADDDCKYDVSFTSTAIQQNTDVTFTVTIKTRVDDQAAAGADANTEIYLDDTHPAPNTDLKTTETSPGVFSIGPIQFDKAGRWTVRFHIHEECVDSETSQHGHVAFYIDVP